MALSPARSAEVQPQQAQAGGVAKPAPPVAPATAALLPAPYGMPSTLYQAIQANNLFQLGCQQVLSVGTACTAYTAHAGAAKLA